MDCPPGVSNINDSSFCCSSRSQLRCCLRYFRCPLLSSFSSNTRVSGYPSLLSFFPGASSTSSASFVRFDLPSALYYVHHERRLRVSPWGTRVVGYPRDRGPLFAFSTCPGVSPPSCAASMWTATRKSALEEDPHREPPATTQRLKDSGISYLRREKKGLRSVRGIKGSFIDSHAPYPENSKGARIPSTTEIQRREESVRQ